MANNWNYGDSYFDGNSYKTRAQAFAAARKNGRGVFTYKGKQYNTMQKGENADEFRRAHADYDYFLGNVAKDQGGWKPSNPVQTSYKVNNVPDEYTKPLPNSSKPQTPTRTKLSMFTNDDIRNLGFRNYAGMVSAIGNKANANNNFVKAMIDRYGSDTSKWNQNTIENDLGVKGTYRSFGGGDFGDMSRAMAGWIVQNNGEIDRQDLQSRTGSDGIVYSNKHVRDLFEAHPVKPKTFTFDTNSFGTNIFGTPKKQQGGQLNMADPIKILQLYTKYRLQKDAHDPEAENTLNQLKAEENEVHDLDSFIDEIKYRWKGNPWLGGYNKTLNAIFSRSSGYDTFKKSTNSTKDNSIPKFINPKQFIKPAKKQQGGQLNMNEQELQQAFLQYLMQKTGAQNEQQLEQVVQQLGEDGLKQAYAHFMQEMQQQQVQAAKFGAKLNYIRKLNGQCPEGMEMYYYKQGGRLCRKCMQVKQNEEEIEYPSNPIDAFKCGRKIKKKKCEIGGTVDMDKCGAKMKKKKCEDGGTVDMDKCGAKIKKKKCEDGGSIPFDKCGKKMKKK